jgi:homoserine/homoserine lactone efflux protein
MNLEIWAAFFIAAMIILIIPGPTIILVVSQAMVHGRKSVIPLVVGVLCGDFSAMTLSLLGLGAILATSATIFMVLKWIGALYLIYLGISLWRSNPGSTSNTFSPEKSSPGALFKSSYIVTALNPKSIAFFVAFLPQFITPREPLLPQLLILGGTFLVLATINAALYAIFAGYLRDALKQRHVRKWFNRCGGCALMGAGVMTAAMQRSS